MTATTDQQLHWLRQRCARLEEERDEARHQLRIVQREGAGPRAEGHLDAQTWLANPAGRDTYWRDREQDLASVDENWRQAWRRVGLYEALRWDCFRHYGIDRWADYAPRELP